MLRHSLGLVGGRRQRVVCLYFLEEMTLDEIALHTGTSRRHAGRIVARFREKVLGEPEKQE